MGMSNISFDIYWKSTFTPTDIKLFVSYTIILEENGKKSAKMAIFA